MKSRIAIQLFLSLMLGSFLASCNAHKKDLYGSGASFPAPLYQRWAADFNKEHPGVSINYQGVGSGAGIRDFTNNLTDFCGSDVPLKSSELDKLHGNVVGIPATGGTIALAYNIPGITKLRLSREAILGIFLGKITAWNHPLITKDNPEITLPALPITIITRSEGSGTTALFTEYFSKISEEFEKKIGSGKSVKWPVGIAGKGTDGVTALIKQTRGSVGYIELGFAQGRLSFADLENKAGYFVTPSCESGASALATWSPEKGVGDPIGVGDYPLTGVTWLFCHKEYAVEKGALIKEFLKYALTNGQLMASQLGYIPLPPTVVEQSLKTLEEIK
ncbi:MAG: phosphate ABC transporter substrate-binding protein PstS [Chthoniobacterales bacterium]|nr:phosphate ABC transporter substrate-binding protein PstS [Chthoniobacterales bacterium]